MSLRWTARAETANTIIMWMGSLLAVLIVVIWVGKNIYPHHLEVQLINSDLEKLQYELSDACNSWTLNRSFNPRIESGLLILNNTYVCIETEKNFNCKDVICNFNFEGRIDLGDLTMISIQKSTEGEISIDAIK